MSEEASLDEFTDEGEISDDVADQPERELIQGVAWSTLARVPDGWIVNNIESDVELLAGNNFSSDDFVDEGGIPLIRIRDLETDETTVNFTGEYDSKYLIEDGDLLVGMDGEFEPHLWSGPHSLLNQRVCKIEAGNQYNKIFLRYATEKPLYYIQKSIAGTTVKHLSQSNIRDINLPTPLLEEQRKIATVLYTVDQAIQRTEEIIEQTEKSKQALMQALFLDGYYEHDENVDAHHRNRLPRHPAEWKTKSARMVMDVTRGAHPRPKSDDSLWGGDIPIIKISDRNRGDSRSITSTDDTVTEKGSQSSKLVDEGTLIVSNAGTVGAARITGMKACIHDHWLILRNFEENLTTRYLYYFINWNQDFLESLASGSTVLDLNTDDFRLFDITIPSLDEQRKITDSLDSLHDQKMVNIRYVDRLHRLKQGLMQDLLSGAVRTHDTDIDIPEAVLAHD